MTYEGLLDEVKINYENKELKKKKKGITSNN